MKKTKQIITLSLALCMALASAAYADESTSTNDSVGKTSGEQLQPYSLYYKDGRINIHKLSGNAKIAVTTYAYQQVSHIYHDITIYVNGSWYSSERYENWSASTLETTIYVPASAGDYIDVYVDHYTEHNGSVEGGHSSNSLTY